MLVLKRLRYFNHFMRDTVDDRIIGPGEWYYVDVDEETGKETGLVISAKHYWELKKEADEENFDKTWFNKMESEKEYSEALRQAEMAYREKTVLNLIKLQDKM